MYQIILLCLCSGLLLTFVTPSFGLWPLIFFAFCPLFFAIEKLTDHNSYSLAKCYGSGVVFGFIFSMSCFYWISNLSLLTMLAVTLAYALIYGLFVPGVVIGKKNGLDGTSQALWTICLWVSLEVLLSDVFWPIPSIAIGYGLWSAAELIQLADITGVFGISFWVLAVNLVVFVVIKQRIKKNITFIGLVILATLFIVGYGLERKSWYRDQFHKKESFRINSIFSSVLTEDKQKLKTEIFSILKQKTILSIKETSKKVDLAIWPETSVPVYLRSVREREYIDGLTDLAKTQQVPILLGALSFERDKENSIKKYNSAFLVPEKGFVSQEYRKNILVPFHESVFNRGDGPVSIKIAGKFNFGVLICYELLFPNFVREIANKNNGFLVNITNDQMAFENIWPAYNIPVPHLVFRVVENRKYLVRSANWGHSMVITPTGHIVQESGIGTTGYLSKDIQLNTVETFFSKNGFLLGKSLLILTLLWAVTGYAVKKISSMNLKYF
ncbi:apolipoprotein N-acyltransferase [Desulforhopalus sp. IMCC35007]|uniref:apolipoprotein N-acyltransferase n=1 Tax=Desulforhopalus sp. IMCC35007 TaxID=2569543 RepID=UPI0010AE651B|nr:apolipoprotein N-acyltransferase [Desulforhopalus sp. IMCC35007]TKB05737.1 apolipoprotein N-acyltransferase [Desulforhopalus sp. IMCC35007]